MGSLLRLRDDILAGDLRSLYLGWLAGVQFLGADEEDAELFEPPVPAGMKKLSASLRELVDFLRIDEQMLRAAAQVSAPAPRVDKSKGEIAKWIAALSEAQKNEYLIRVTEGRARQVQMELDRRFRQSILMGAIDDPVAAPSRERRTIRELLSFAQT